MQCQICNNKDATIHLTEITDGVRSEMHICEQCAAEQGIAIKSHIPINELLSSLLAVQPTDDEFCCREAEHNRQKIGYGFQPHPKGWNAEFHPGVGLRFDDEGRARV